MAFVLVNDLLFETCRVNGPSMAPTLSPDFYTAGAKDTVLFYKNAGEMRRVRRGDIVVYHSLKYPEKLSVKRVVAIEEDTVILPWGEKGVYPGGKVLVPFNHVWIEGDNREKSLDSRHHGPISKNLIVGKAMGIVFPLSRMGRIDTHGPKRPTLVIERSAGAPPLEIGEVAD
ncbi:peptidase S24/S26A/S26B/S26C [Lineolata rhizophorae]|uniref:Mitochondrial inner membrane protease subunit n=1 Tax=Lineolata rhizophorae TaxID=578093 RepID=A0A6A6NX10_9PEZI|nr:peptidase S24/S26A/S26B/S26C [Lineolata rhizophorae]